MLWVPCSFFQLADFVVVAVVSVASNLLLVLDFQCCLFSVFFFAGFAVASLTVFCQSLLFTSCPFPSLFRLHLQCILGTQGNGVRPRWRGNIQYPGDLYPCISMAVLLWYPSCSIRHCSLLVNTALLFAGQYGTALWPLLLPLGHLALLLWSSWTVSIYIVHDVSQCKPLALRRPIHPCPLICPFRKTLFNLTTQRCWWFTT